MFRMATKSRRNFYAATSWSTIVPRPAFGSLRTSTRWTRSWIWWSKRFRRFLWELGFRRSVEMILDAAGRSGMDQKMRQGEFGHFASNGDCHVLQAVHQGV